MSFQWTYCLGIAYENGRYRVKAIYSCLSDFSYWFCKMERQWRQSAIAATNALWRNERGHDDNYFETSVVEDDICHDESEEDCDEIESNSEDENEGESESEDDTAPNVQNVMEWMNQLRQIYSERMEKYGCWSPHKLPEELVRITSLGSLDQLRNVKKSDGTLRHVWSFCHKRYGWHARKVYKWGRSQKTRKAMEKYVSWRNSQIYRAVVFVRNISICWRISWKLVGQRTWKEGLSLDNEFTQNEGIVAKPQIWFKERTYRNEKNDKMAAIRGFFNAFQLQLPKYFKPDHYVTIDEQLVAFRGRCSFRQYMPNKPAKYGLDSHALLASTR